MKGKIIILVIIILVVDVLILLIDYSYIAINGLNVSLLSTLLTNSVTIILHSLTYYLIDKRTIGKTDNQSSIAKTMIEESYKSVEEMMNVLTPDIAKKFLIPKLKFNDSFMNQTLFLNLVNKPFCFDEQIIEFVQNGFVSSDDFKTYVKIKSDFLSFVNMTITFYDKKELSDMYKNQIIAEIKQYREKKNE